LKNNASYTKSNFARSPQRFYNQMTESERIAVDGMTKPYEEGQTPARRNRFFREAVDVVMRRRNSQISES
jgi:type VI protein secretion system component VasK